MLPRYGWAIALSLVAGAAVAQPGPTVVVPNSSLVHPEDAGHRAHTNVRYLKLDPRAAPPSLYGARADLPPFPGLFFETPASLACLYALVPKTFGCNPQQVTQNTTGGSRAIAIVDAFDNPTVLADLQAYSAQFGLPAPNAANFQIVFATGTRPARDDGWGLEIALDVQMAHAMAPKAKVILVEAASNSFFDLFQAERVAANLVAAAGGGQVSNSWGSDEFAGETSAASTTPFVKNKVVFFASTGDADVTSYPAVLPQLVAAGGTTVRRDASGKLLTPAKSTWNEAGAGKSSLVARPAFQAPVAGVVGTKRGIADLSAAANPATGVWVRFRGSWFSVGGTNVSSPLLAGIANLAGHFAANTAAEQALIYGHLGTGAFRDIKNTASNCGVGNALHALLGYDFCTGVGSPLGLAGL